MKKKGCFACTLILALALLGCRGEEKTENYYGEDGKLRKDITLEEIRKIEHDYGDLLGVSYYNGGGMEGSSHDTMLEKQKDGSCLIQTRDAGSFSFPFIVREYKTDGAVFAKLEALIEKDNLALWDSLPFDDEFMVLDAPSTSLYLYYDESKTGGYSYTSYSIHYDNVIPEGGGSILQEFTRVMFAEISPENLTDTYFEIDGTAVRTGRDDSLTDEQVYALFGGYWRETGKEDAVVIYTYGLEETLEVTIPEDGSYRDKILTCQEIVHTPWKEADASFHVLMRDEEGEDWVLYIENCAMVLERADGSEVHILERVN